ncbi:hypothetical protein DFR50_1405 [Roseiarcus fermentans]|uniref:Uncharacterized protein n=1 Tax=Roseiarcus fermentans TaxID=1473586 RepID=A0A366ENZ2_9HYPH|nr:hypothetical protein [Roseiarcus fermentans]RBP04133.1 hypothetical protein DFR50_1405 [Roseiarcus fermentans]
MADLATFAESVEVIESWRCIGCGRVEASRPCVGVCQDRRARLVELDAFVAALDRVDRAETRAADLEAFVRLVATTRAKPGGAEATLAALQTRARALLAGVAARRSDEAGGGTP